MIDTFHFIRPLWLVALPLLWWICWWLQRHRQRSGWQHHCDGELLPHILIGSAARRSALPIVLLWLAATLPPIALAGPTWQEQPQPIFRQQSALVILLDLSQSMNAADLKPNRLTRARLKITDLLRDRREGQTALIVFAADAFTVVPLTEDNHTITALLGSLQPELMPAQGSRPERAIELGVQLFQQAGAKQGMLLLVTDDDAPQQAQAAARAAHQAGYDLAVLGVGRAEGAPIPLAQGGFVKDSNGQMVLPRLNSSALKTLAQAGGGLYHPLTIDNRDLDTLLSALETSTEDPQQESRHSTTKHWQDEGPWLLWPLAVLAAVGFRRGWLMMLCLLVWAAATDPRS